MAATSFAVIRCELTRLAFRSTPSQPTNLMNLQVLSSDPGSTEVVASPHLAKLSFLNADSVTLRFYSRIVLAD